MHVAWPAGYRACALITLDLDAESSLLYSHPESAHYLDVMAVQTYGMRAGLDRLLRVLDKYDLRATMFVPGYTVERWPEPIRMIRDAGHELAHHGYLHESVHGVTTQQEEAYLLRTIEAFEQNIRVRPVGYRAPRFNMNMRTPALLAKHGFRYDSSLQDADVPYWLTVEDSGEDTAIVEIPVQYALDDGTYYLHMPGFRSSTTLESPAKALEIWSLEYDAIAREGGCFTLTLHPYLSGRPSRAEIVDRLLQRIAERGDTWLPTCSALADHMTAHRSVRIHHDAPKLSNLP